MSSIFQKILLPEIFLGLVAPVGADLNEAVGALSHHFEQKGYKAIVIKVTDVFHVLKNYIVPEEPIVTGTTPERYHSHISYGNLLRDKFTDDAILAAMTIARVVRMRIRHRREDSAPFTKTVYILHSFKRKEEVELLKSVYGRAFFQISVYSRRGARVDYLARIFASGKNKASSIEFRSAAEKLIRIDEDEFDVEHGQRVQKIFHLADFVINNDVVDPDVNSQVKRFCDLIFSSNAISPTKLEYGMFCAKGAALRTLDLSRQVGAAIFAENGTIISMGSNEVPKATGGTYWADENFDDREYVRRHDSNDRRKKEILSEIIEIILPDADVSSILNKKSIQDSQFMDALEYGRIVHAEMVAITDAARLGRPILGATLFCTTFPCHMCAKHIVAAGLDQVVFLEPYPKSLALELHSDSLEVEGSDRGRYQSYPSVKFEHFYGVTPRRYREFFERAKRKSSEGRFLEYPQSGPTAIFDIKYPLYADLEERVLEYLKSCCSSMSVDDDKLASA